MTARRLPATVRWFFEIRANGSPVGALQPPGNLTAVAGDHEGQIALDWDPVPGASSYEVDCKLHSDAGVWERVKSATASDLVVTGLTPGTQYAFRIRAVGAAGAGPWSDEAVRRAP